MESERRANTLPADSLDMRVTATFQQLQTREVRLAREYKSEERQTLAERAKKPVSTPRL